MFHGTFASCALPTLKPRDGNLCGLVSYKKLFFELRTLGFMAGDKLGQNDRLETDNT
jgi:hypothetical protein